MGVPPIPKRDDPLVGYLDRPMVLWQRSGVTTQIEEGETMDSAARDFLHELLSTPSPSGYEQPVARLWRKRLAEVCPSIDVDGLGNSVAEIPGTGGGRRILLTAHVDEIGFMITRIDGDGFCRFRNVGGPHRQVVPGQAMLILDPRDPAAKPLRGIVGWNGYASTTSKEVQIADLYVDLGVSSKEEAETLVRPGAPMVIDAPPRPLAGTRMAARAFDDRLGAFIVSEVARAYGADPGATTLLAAATTMEEIGCYGGATVAHGRNVDAALWLDVTYDTLVPGVEPDTYGAHGIGKGPVLAVGSILSPILTHGLEDKAAELSIPLQSEICPNQTMTEADLLQLTERGIPHAGLFIAARNVHTPVEIVDLNDVDDCIRLLTEYLKALPADLDLRRL